MMFPKNFQPVGTCDTRLDNKTRTEERIRESVGEQKKA
tara:strand:+ start:451 stop:564 length:114 start_codon:yes stop_codon:yes gene_type:complete